MKKILFVLIFAPSISFARQVTIEIPDSEIAIVEDSVIDAVKWLESAWKGKVENCKDRIVNKEVELSIKGNESLPAGKDAIINKYLTRPDYKSRKEIEK